MAAELLDAPYPRFCCNWVSKACKVAPELEDDEPELVELVLVEVEPICVRSAATLAKALCNSAGADPLLA